MGEIVTYSEFPVLTPSSSNKVVGAVNINNFVYCRRCVERLGLEWNKMKYLTKSKALLHIYNCVACGKHIAKKHGR
jgi:hypothetical protein